MKKISVTLHPKGFVRDREEKDGRCQSWNIKILTESWRIVKVVWFSLETLPHTTEFGIFSGEPLEPSQRALGMPWTSVWELVHCSYQHLLFSNQCSSKECSFEQALILCGPIRSLPCLLFPGSFKVLTNDRWPNVETTAQYTGWKNKNNNMGMQWFTETKRIKV